MKQRNIAAVIALSVVTGGIYDLFWLVQVKKVLNERTQVRVPSIWILFAPLVALIVALIISLAVSASDANTTTNTAAQFYGSTSNASINDPSTTTAATNILTIVIGIVAVVVVFPLTFYWFFKFSKAVSAYTNGEMSLAVTFLLLYLLRFIGIAILQDHFNTMVAAGNTGCTQPAGYAPAAPVYNAPQAQPTYQAPPQSPEAPTAPAAPQWQQPIAPDQQPVALQSQLPQDLTNYNPPTPPANPVV